MYDLARIAFNGEENGESALILVTHDSVIGQIPHLKGTSLKTEHLGVNHFAGNNVRLGFNS